MIWLFIAVIISITPFKIILNLTGRGKYNLVIHYVMETVSMPSSVARSKQSDTGFMMQSNVIETYFMV
jgi:hypothetical protein